MVDAHAMMNGKTENDTTTTAGVMTMTTLFQVVAVIQDSNFSSSHSRFSSMTPLKFMR